MDRLQRLNLPLGSALPATLWLRADRVEAVASGLRRGFANPSPAFYLSALRGLVFWVRCSSTPGFGKANRLPAPPVELLRELGPAVAFRRPDALAFSLDAAYHVLRRLDPDANVAFVNLLLIGLEYLTKKLSYRGAAGRDGQAGYDDVPWLRERTARLAGCLANQGFADHPRRSVVA